MMTFVRLIMPMVILETKRNTETYYQQAKTGGREMARRSLFSISACEPMDTMHGRPMQLVPVIQGFTVSQDYRIVCWYFDVAAYEQDLQQAYPHLSERF